MSQASTTLLQPGKLQRTRQRLVQAIREEIRDTGHFTADRVAQRAGSSAATFYNHFSTKDDALLAAYEALMAELDETIAARCRIEPLLDQGLESFVSGWLLDTAQFFSRNASLFRLAQAAIEQSKALRDIYRRHESDATRVYQRFLELGQAARVIRRGDPLALAQVLVVITEGWYHPLVQKLERDSPLHREMTAAVVRVLAAEPNDRGV